MKYSSWNKWDLHVHTRASKVKSGNNEYFGAGYSFTPEECKLFSDTITNAGIKLVAITDHNHFDANQFLLIKEQFINNNGNALPGIELKVFYYLNSQTKEVEYPLTDDTSSFQESKPLHCVIIFNDDLAKESLFYINIQQLFETLYNNSDCIYIGKVIEACLQNNYEFILIPHFVKHNDLEKAIKDKNSDSPILKNMEMKTKWIVGGFFSGLDGNVSKIKQSKIRAINYLRENYEFSLPIIMTSDNHNFRNYTNDVSEYKALPTFAGLKLCFSDYSQRIRYQKEDIAKQDVISKMILKSNAEEKILSCEIDLSPYLNCIIGGRSSGKSLLLALLGKAVGERTNNHIDQNQRNEYNKFIERYNKYINKTDVILLRADGSTYDGRTDIYLQDSIIKRFETDSSSALATDFRDEFNEDENSDIEVAKDGYINDIKKLIDLMDRISIELKSLKSRGNIVTNLPMPDISNNFIFYTDTATTICDGMKTDAKNLQQLRKALLDLKTDYAETLKKHNSINDALQSLIESINSEVVNANNSYEKYNRLLGAIIAIKDDLGKQHTEAVKQHNAIREGILNLVGDIIKYIKIHGELDIIINKINKFVEAEFATENVVGDYRFVVNNSSKLTSAVVLDILNSYRVDSFKVNSLKEFVESYVKEEKKWSHSRSSENIKNRLGGEISKYIKKEYHIYEKDELINEMSEGRKASVFIDILLNKEHSQFPIIIDQPEDNMDNRDISMRLVESLRNRKNNRQIIVVTHNPNVLVNGDAENVIIAEKRDNNQICYVNGAIEYAEEFDMIKNICKLVEGGANAFLKRERKYGLDITDSRNYGGVNND